METTFQLRGVEPIGSTYSIKPADRHSRAAAEEVAFENARALTKALHDTPAVRDDVVRRATDLVGDVNYPPPETIRMISHLLAIQMDDDGQF